MPAPRAFRDPAQVAARLELLKTAPSVQPLLAWSTEFAARRTAATGIPTVVPHFDPAEAGVRTRVLCVFEAPGPMTNAGNKRPGSGFISADNNDQTAENDWLLRNETGLTEDITLNWNIVPFYLGPASKKPNIAELKEGAVALLEMMELLPDLRVIVVGGLFAQNGIRRHVTAARPDVEVIDTWHPSPLALKQRGKRDELREAFRAAAAIARL